jgi:hypothetical protein
MAYQLTSEEQAALDALLPVHDRTGNLHDDLATAVPIGLQLRRDLTRHCMVMITALFRESWRTHGRP